MPRFRRTQDWASSNYFTHKKSRDESSARGAKDIFEGDGRAKVPLRDEVYRDML